ncbi:MAG: hypothetical protein K6U08_09070, partial [Firmicutes bacterium]|nr:hypothetical protein [Bacillota bacterium]
RRTRLTDPEGRVFTYRYDAAGQVTAFLDPDGSETRLGYDGAGRLTEVAYPNGVTETRAYDAAGRLAELCVRGPEGLLESYVYTRDARGFATKRVEEDGATTTWAYDAAGRLVRVDYPADKIQAIRDEQGAAIERVKAATAADEGADPPSGGKADSGAGDRLADVAYVGSGFVIAKGHGNGGGNAGGNGGGSDQGNGQGNGNGGGQSNGSGPNNGRGGGQADGNAGGKGKEKGAGQGAAADTTEGFVPPYTLPVREWVEYQYDGAGNRVRETSDLGATDYEYDAANRLLKAGDVSFAYDAAGRLTRRVTAGQVVTYGYDVAGRLREVSYEDGTGVAYGYDAVGRKVFREATFWSQPDPERRGPSENGLEHGKGFERGRRNGQENGRGHAGTPPGLSRPHLETETTTYLWDGLRVLAEYTDKGAPLAEYYTAAGRVLARKMFGYHDRKEPGAPDLKTNGGLLYYTYDGIGNVSLLTDRLGEAEARYRYDAFGGLLTGATAPYNLYGPFAKEFDPASGLVYFGARWYDAAVGRFTTPDPIPGTLQDPLTLNLYLFALANPVNFVDRWGLHPEDPVLTVNEGPDFVEVYLKYVVDQRDTYSTREVSRTPAEIIREHTHRHYHQYFVWDFRRDLRVREDGWEYWETVRDEEYTTDWVLVGEDSWREVIDLVAWKQDALLGKAGPAPPSEVGSGSEVPARGDGARTSDARWIVSAGIGFIPILGEVKDIQEALTGVDLVTGERLSVGERLLTAVLFVVPFVGGCAVRGVVRAAGELADAARAGKAIPRITAKGLGRVEQHLDDILRQQGIPKELQAGERAMLERLRSGRAATQDVEFYLHELKESSSLRRTGDLRKAHQEALGWRGVTEKDLFHPDVIQRYPELFGPGWR